MAESFDKAWSVVKLSNPAESALCDRCSYRGNPLHMWKISHDDEKSKRYICDDCWFEDWRERDKSANLEGKWQT